MCYCIAVPWHVLDLLPSQAILSCRLSFCSFFLTWLCWIFAQSHFGSDPGMAIMRVAVLATLLALGSLASALPSHTRGLRAAGLLSQGTQLPSEVWHCERLRLSLRLV